MEPYPRTVQSCEIHMELLCLLDPKEALILHLIIIIIIILWFFKSIKVLSITFPDNCFFFKRKKKIFAKKRKIIF